MRVVLILLFLISLSYTKEMHYLTVGSYASKTEAIEALTHLKQDTLIAELHKRYPFSFEVAVSEDHFHIKFKDFESDDTPTLLYTILKQNHSHIQSNYKQTILSNGYDSIWLLILFIIFLIINFVMLNQLYRKYTILKVQHTKLKHAKSRLSAKYDEILNNLGYKIERSTKDMIRARDKIINEPIKELTPGVLRHKFKRIQDTDKILTDTSNQVIDFLKAKSGNLKLVKRSFDINRLLEAVTMFVSQNYKGESVELIYHVNTNVPHYIVGDYRRLGEILINIIDYAYSHTSSGFVKLIISTFKTDRKSMILEFKIIDSSGGVNKAQEAKLFVPFHNASSKHGLFLSKEFATLMGGSLKFISREGRGNVFAVNVPLEIDTQRQQEYALNSQVVSHKDLQDKSIGIIERNEDIGDALKSSFLHFLPNVKRIADFSLEDVDVIKRFDIILIEHSMITHRILDTFKEVQNEKELNVIAMHNILNTHYKQVADSSIDRYIPKPISPSSALKVFLKTYNQPKIVQCEAEIIYSEKIEEQFESHLPKQYFEPLPETQEASKSFLKDYLGSSLLIIDDNELHHKIYSDTIKGSGVKYALAKNSQEAITQLSQYYNRFDLMLINLEINHNRGFVLAKMIRTHENYQKIPLVAVVDREHIPNDIISIGINAYILKPIKVTNIYTILNCFLEKTNLSSPFAKLTQSEHILDITRGIMQANHDESTYLELIKEFQGAYGTSDELLQQYIKEHDYIHTKELVSNMKSLSDILGANDMYRLLHEIEQLLDHKRYNKISNYVSRYTEELEHLNTNIEIYIRSMKSNR